MDLLTLDPDPCPVKGSDSRGTGAGLCASPRRGAIARYAGPGGGPPVNVEVWPRDVAWEEHDRRGDPRADPARHPHGRRRPGAGRARCVRCLAPRDAHGLEPGGAARRCGVVGDGVRRGALRRRGHGQELVGRPEVRRHRHARPGLAALRAAVHREGPAGHPSAGDAPGDSAGRRSHGAGGAGHTRPGALLPGGSAHRAAADRRDRTGVLGDLRLQQPAARRRDGAVPRQHGAAGADLPPDGPGAAALRAAAVGGEHPAQPRDRLVRPDRPDAVRVHRHRRTVGLGPVRGAVGRPRPARPERGGGEHDGRRARPRRVRKGRRRQPGRRRARGQDPAAN